MSEACITVSGVIALHFQDCSAQFPIPYASTVFYEFSESKDSLHGLINDLSKVFAEMGSKLTMTLLCIMCMHMSEMISLIFYSPNCICMKRMRSLDLAAGNIISQHPPVCAHPSLCHAVGIFQAMMFCPPLISISPSIPLYLYISVVRQTFVQLCNSLIAFW